MIAITPSPTPTPIPTLVPVDVELLDRLGELVGELVRDVVTADEVVRALGLVLVASPFATKKP